MIVNQNRNSLSHIRLTTALSDLLVVLLWYNTVSERKKSEMGRQDSHRYIICLFLGILTVCMPAAQSIADNATTNETEEIDDVKRITGTISKVSFVFSSLMLICDLGYVTFSVPANATIVRSGRPIKLEELKTGETITIQYRHPYPSAYIADYIRASDEFRE